jgi:hypothetical protein
MRMISLSLSLSACDNRTDKEECELDKFFSTIKQVMRRLITTKHSAKHPIKFAQ